MNVAHAPSGSVGRYPVLARRRPLGQIRLAGGRARWHVVVRWTLVGLAGLIALLVATERHRVCDAWGACDPDDWGAAHTLASDLGPLPFVLLAAVVALQLGAIGGRVLATLATAIGTLVAALVLFGGVAMAHFLSNVDGGAGAGVLTFGLVALALAQVVLEPVLVFGQRRRLAAVAPRGPAAAVVAR